MKLNNLSIRIENLFGSKNFQKMLLQAFIESDDKQKEDQSSL